MFASLFRVMGAARFDLALRTYFQRYASNGGTTDNFSAVFASVGGPPAEAVLDDWLNTTRWVDTLRAAPSFNEAIGVDSR